MRVKNEVVKIDIPFNVLKGQCNSKAEFSAAIILVFNFTWWWYGMIYADLVLKKHFLFVYNLSAAHLFIWCKLYTFLNRFNASLLIKSMYFLPKKIYNVSLSTVDALQSNFIRSLRVVSAPRIDLLESCCFIHFKQALLFWVRSTACLQGPHKQMFTL